MTSRIFNPDGVPAPLAAYSHGARQPTQVRVVHSAGQVASGGNDEAIPSTFREQAEVVWDRLAKILTASNMALTDIVKINFYLTDASDVVVNREVFTNILSDHRPPTTLVVVSRLTRPEYKIEIEIVAARPRPTKARYTLRV